MYHLIRPSAIAGGSPAQDSSFWSNRWKAALVRWNLAIAVETQSQIAGIEARDWSPLVLGCLLISLPLSTSVLALRWIATPPTPRCEQSDSLRSDLAALQCLRQSMHAAQPQAVLAGLHQLQAWPQDSPVYGVAQRLREDWSQVAYSQAQEAFEKGDWATAAQLTAAIPPEAPLGAKAQTRLDLWQQIQAQGERVYDLAQGAMQSQDWSQALEYAQTLATLPNDYWRRQGLHELPSRIAQAQGQPDQALEPGPALVSRGPQAGQERPHRRPLEPASPARSRPSSPVSSPMLVSIDRLRVTGPKPLAPEFSWG